MFAFFADDKKQKRRLCFKRAGAWFSYKVDSIVRPVIGDNLMPDNKFVDFIYYVFLRTCGARMTSRSFNDLFFNMWVIKKKREISKDNNGVFLDDLSDVLSEDGNIWISWTNGRSKEDRMQTYKNLSRLNEMWEFNVLPVNLSYGLDIYPTANDRISSSLPKPILDILDMFNEARAQWIDINLWVWESKPFSDYSKEDLEEIIFCN